MKSSEKKWFRQPLGEVLQQAYLVSAFQLEEALKEQATGRVGTLGEILAAKGWLKKETADFFASKWAMLVNQPNKQPLGYYLKESALLDESQIHQIVSEQSQERLWIRLGANAVLKGWLSQSTVDFLWRTYFLNMQMIPLSSQLEKINEFSYTQQRCLFCFTARSHSGLEL